MNVTVFGATGGVGRLAVRRLLEDGHDVTAVVRTPAKLNIAHPRLTVTTAVLSDAEAVRAAVSGAGAVISALGPPLKRSIPGTPLADGTRNIVRAMEEQKVERFIGLATPSVPDPRDRPHWKHKVLPLIAGLAFRDALTEVRAMTELVTTSGLDYTIARISSPVNGSAKGRIRSGFLGHDRVGSRMTRADIATFLVTQLTDPRHSKSMPAISN